ncbi:hypothetical protein D5086_026998 [Populus alba]|uniref:Uncharacterized protein n=1 Tax=Populus alba TaxID=43335 RepID=A0ACC4B3U9_POPAL
MTAHRCIQAACGNRHMGELKHCMTVYSWRPGQLEMAAMGKHNVSAWRNDCVEASTLSNMIEDMLKR